jgi:hypothetical protein
MLYEFHFIGPHLNLSNHGVTCHDFDTIGKPLMSKGQNSCKKKYRMPPLVLFLFFVWNKEKQSCNISYTTFGPKGTWWDF